MIFSNLQRLIVFSLSFLFFSLTTGYAQSEKFYSEIKKEEARGDNSSDKDAMDKLDKHPNAKDVHYFKLGNISKIHKNGLFDFPSPLDEETIHAMTKRIEYKSDNDYYWYGTLTDSSLHGEMMLIAEKGKICGYLKYKNYSYQIFGIGNKISAFLPSLNDTVKGFGCRDNFQKSKIEAEPQQITTQASTLLSNCPVSNRILILYTQAALNDNPNIVQTARTGVAQFNQALQNSGIATPEAYLTIADIRLISSFNETSTPNSLGYTPLDNDLNAFRNNNDVKNFIKGAFADLTIVLTNGGYDRTAGIYGIANTVNPQSPYDAWAFVEEKFALGTRLDVGGPGSGYPFVHELGHLFGGGHELSSIYGAPAVPYARGYYFTHRCFFCITTNVYKTVMHVGTGGDPNLNNPIPILQFSSPLLTYEGVLAGDASLGDMARRITEVSPTIAALSPSAGQLTGSISGPQNINSFGYYTYSSTAECGLTPYTYQWDISSDGYTYFNNSTGSSVSIGVYPNSSYAQSGHIYLRLTITSSDGQSFTIFYNAYVNNIHYFKTGGTDKLSDKLALNISLSDPYPNPSNNSAIIEFSVTGKRNLTLSLLNELGQNIQILQLGDFESGTYQCNVSTNSLSTGEYYCMLKSGESTIVKKLIVSK